MILCPACNLPRARPSRTRSLKERLVKLISSRRPHRCRNCGWRGVIDPVIIEKHAATLVKAWTAPRPAPDYNAIDSAAGPKTGFGL